MPMRPNALICGILPMIAAVHALPPAAMKQHSLEPSTHDLERTHVAKLKSYDAAKARARTQGAGA